MLSVEGEIICASARECSFFCVATDVYRRIVLGLLSPKEHGLLKKAAPCKIWGFPPPDFVPTRRGESRAWHQYLDEVPGQNPRTSF